MPAKNRIKIFVEDGYYHAYNRGVEKRNIFMDDADYRVFLNYLKTYLSPQNLIQLNHPLLTLYGSGPAKSNRTRIKKTFYGEITLLSYCLMPNHFHLLLQQKNISGMTSFIRALSTSYSMYFNTKYKRNGTLFQGIYKAVLVTKDEYLLHLSRYIHLNPKDLLDGSDPDTDRKVQQIINYPYSSYAYYLGKKCSSWIKPQIVLNYFSLDKNQVPLSIQHQSYEEFVNDYQLDNVSILENLAIDQA